MTMEDLWVLESHDDQGMLELYWLDLDHEMVIQEKTL